MSGYVGGGVKPIALYDSYTQAQANGLLDNKVDSPSLTSVSGTAVFTNSDNNISLTGIGGIGLEVGDVISVVGSASNDKLFTVEVITDVDNLIVNAAHAGGTTSKSLVNETVNATVTLVAKWFNAAAGLGQDWVDVTASRANATIYTNNTQRQISVSVRYDTSVRFTMSLSVNGEVVSSNTTSAVTGGTCSVYAEIPLGSNYELTRANTIFWMEMR